MVKFSYYTMGGNKDEKNKKDNNSIIYFCFVLCDINSNKCSGEKESKT